MYINVLCVLPIVRISYKLYVSVDQIKMFHKTLNAESVLPAFGVDWDSTNDRAIAS